jgi:hypothetical protein
MRNSIRVISLILFMAFFVLAVGGGLFWANLNFTRRAPGGADFVVLWKSAQNYMLQGITPYGQDTARDVQRIIYGRPARRGENPYLANVPFHLLLFFFLIGWIRDLAIARSIWMILLEVAAIGTMMVSMLLSRWKPAWPYLILLLLFSLFWMPSVSTIISGGLILLQALLLFGAVRAIEQDADELAGALAAISLINVEAVGLVLLLLAVWAFSARRWRIFAGFLMTSTLLLVLSFLIFPAWFLPFAGTVLATWRLDLLPSPFNLFNDWLPGIGTRLAQILRGVVVTVLVVEWVAARRKDTHWLFWTACLTAALTPLVGFGFAPGWVTFSMPGLVLALSVMDRRWGVFGRLLALLVLLLVFFGLWAAQIAEVVPVFILVYPIILAVILYWVRWWAIRPPRLWMDLISQGN